MTGVKCSWFITLKAGKADSQYIIRGTIVNKNRCFQLLLMLASPLDNTAGGFLYSIGKNKSFWVYIIHKIFQFAHF